MYTWTGGYEPVHDVERQGDGGIMDDSHTDTHKCDTHGTQYLSFNNQVGRSGFTCADNGICQFRCRTGD